MINKHRKLIFYFIQVKNLILKQPLLYQKNKNLKIKYLFISYKV
jgi:hypothetical protein